MRVIFLFSDENIPLLMGWNPGVLEGTPVLATRHSDHVKMVKEGGYTYIIDMTALELETAQDCKLAIMKEKFVPFYYALGTQNNSVYRDLISEQ